MKKGTVIILLILCVFLLSFKVDGQSKKEVLTNDKIIELVKLGLGESIIIEKIRQSECQCDTSTNGLTKLKTAKISDAVIMAMLEAASGGKTYSESGNNNQKTSPSTSNLPVENQQFLSQITEPGIYLLENGEMKQLEPTNYTGTKSSFWGVIVTQGIKKAKFKAVVRGKSANLHTSTLPEFYFVFSREYSNSAAVMAGGFYGYAATSPAEFMMVQMEIKDKSRESIIGEFGAFGSSTGTPEKFIREFSFEKIKPGTYKVVPKTNLAVGEYCFFYAGAGGAMSKIFDFSVK